MSNRTATICALNYAFRSTLVVGGQTVFTSGVASLDTEQRAQVLNTVRTFNNFTPSNDPCGEHDFGSFDIGDLHFIWKIDYYDQSLAYGSEAPADSQQTERVLTIMLAEEH